MMGKRKAILLFITLGVALLFIAWKIKPVELIDDKLLIDLDTLIQDAEWGQEDSPDDDSVEVVPGEKNPDIDSAIDTDVTEEITVVVRGEKFLVNNVNMRTSATLQKYLEQYLTQQDGENIRVCLVDDYAEAHAYKKVYELLQLLQLQIPFKISEVMSEG